MMELKWIMLGSRMVELKDGSMLYVEEGEVFEVSSELGEKLVASGGFEVISDNVPSE